MGELRVVITPALSQSDAVLVINSFIAQMEHSYETPSGKVVTWSVVDCSEPSLIENLLDIDHPIEIFCRYLNIAQLEALIAKNDEVIS